MGQGINYKCDCGYELKELYGVGFMGIEQKPVKELKKFMKQVEKGTAKCPNCGKPIEPLSLMLINWD